MNSLYEPLRTIVEDLRFVRVGLKKRPLKVGDPKSGSSKAQEDNERFKISFQIAGNSVSWEVVFDKQTPLMPPDIITGAEDEEFCPCLDELKGYTQWDPSVSNCLSDLLMELIQHYSSYQKELIQSYPRLSDHWTNLCQSTNYSKSSEVYIAKNGPGTFNAVATLLFELSFDLSELPPYLSQKNIGESSAALQLTFQQPDLTTVEPKLFLSPRLDHAIGGVSNIRLPTYGLSDIATYIERVDMLLRNTVKDATERYVRRKELVSCFIAEYHGSVVEYDAEKYSQITLLLFHNNFHFILFVLVGERFPAAPPTLVLQSVYHKVRRNPYRQSHKGYLYSPNWEPKKIVQAIREYLADVIMDFKQDSITACARDTSKLKSNSHS